MLDSFALSVRKGAQGVFANASANGDYPVAWDENDNRVPGYGPGYGAGSITVADFLGQFAIGHGVAVPDLAQAFPNQALEIGALGAGFQGKVGAFSGKILKQLVLSLAAGVLVVFNLPAVIQRQIILNIGRFIFDVRGQKTGANDFAVQVDRDKEFSGGGCKAVPVYS